MGRELEELMAKLSPEQKRKIKERKRELMLEVKKEKLKTPQNKLSDQYTKEKPALAKKLKL